MADVNSAQQVDSVTCMYPLINRDNTCSFSGYRPEKLPWGTSEDDPRCTALKARLKAIAERVVLSGIRHFICGMARGSDTYFCEAMLFLREEKYPQVSVEAAIPYEEQASRWFEEERSRYSLLLKQCDFVTCISREYTRNCMFRRNRYLVDSSSILLAVYDGKPGGTKYTLEYAMRRGIEIIEIAP